MKVLVERRTHKLRVQRCQASPLGSAGLLHRPALCGTLLLSWLLFTACAAQSGPSIAFTDLKELGVVAAITPGKPDAPTEKISLITSNSAGGVVWHLTVARLSPAGETLKSGSATVPTAEVEGLWRIIEKGKLRSLRLELLDGQVFDFGKRSLHFEWRPASGDPGVRDSSWEKPLIADHEKLIDPLFRDLSRLARHKVPTVSLAYFPE